MRIAAPNRRSDHSPRSSRGGAGNGPAIDRLSTLDRFMRGVSATWPQDIGALAILDGPTLFDADGRFRLDAVRAVIDRRLHVAPRFRQIVVEPRRGLGGPYWADASRVDLSDHVRELHLEPPFEDDRLTAAVEELVARRLDLSRPLWEMWFLTGLPHRRVGLFVKIHHSVADGMAAMATVMTFLDRTPESPPAAPASWTPAPGPSNRQLLLDNLVRRARGLTSALSPLTAPRATLRRARAAWPAIRELLAEPPATRTSLDRIVGDGRRVALIGGSLGAVRMLGRTHDATVNDVLLAVTAGGLRKLLEARGEPVRGTFRIYVPVSLRRRFRGPQQGNRIAQMAVPLDLGEADPERRLRRIAGETTIRKARARTSLGNLMVGGRLGRQLILAAVMRQRVNATSASIPGPTRSLYLAGARLLEVYPVLPLVANEPLGIGALSYAGTLSIGVTADRDAFPDFDVFVDGVRDEFRRLASSALEAETRRSVTIDRR
jgi:diacylglycerol O-acyltransferase / wax synthase